jgi:hypothetical protein
VNNYIEIKFDKHIVFIDHDDEDLFFSYKWKIKVSKSNYIICCSQTIDKKTKKRKTLWLHQIIKPKPNNKVRAFFKDGNRLNCKKENIEYVSNSFFSHRFSKNRIKSNSSVSFKGVTQLFQSRIKFNKKLHIIGQFKSSQEAAKAYNEKAIELYGSKAKLNTL